jgi:hypothetical protein
VKITRIHTATLALIALSFAASACGGERYVQRYRAFEEQQAAEAKAKADADAMKKQDETKDPVDVEPEPQVFTASDGKEFDDKADYEAYQDKLDEQARVEKMRNSRSISATVSGKPMTNKKGSCFSGYTTYDNKIVFCLTEGLPKNLDDDGIARVRVTLNATTPEAATPKNYQLKVSRDGKQLFVGRGDKNATPGASDTQSIGSWTSKMPFGDWLNGTYDFELVYAKDTDQRVNVQLLVEEATVPPPSEF